MDRKGDRLEQVLALGASSKAIQSHYDVSNEFFALWLDAGMTYSSAMWVGSADCLEAAQNRKIDYHIDYVCPGRVRRLLDVGCGWGSLMSRVLDLERAESVVGLTMSAAQAAYIADRGDERAAILLEDWREHRPSDSYDAIVSIGAIEHFVRPETPAADRVEIYRHFFEACHRWLAKDGRMSLQSIVYGAGVFTPGAIATVFPESDLPRLSEIVQACEGLFELVSLRSDRSDYARTVREWCLRLNERRDAAIDLAGSATVERYGRFLRASERGFELGVFNLVRIHLAPYRESRSVPGRRQGGS